MQPYRRITLAVGVSMFVDASLYLAVLPLLPHYVDRFGLKTFQAGLVLAAYPISVPFVSLGCIVLVPRVGARRIALCLGGADDGGHGHLRVGAEREVLILARFVQGFASGSIWTSSMSWVTDNAPAGQRGRESGIVMGMLSAGSIAGPGIGGLAAMVGSGIAFGLVAVVCCRGRGARRARPRRSRGRRGRVACGRRSPRRAPAGHEGRAGDEPDRPLAFGAVDLLVPLRLGSERHLGRRDRGCFAAGARAGRGCRAVGGPLVDRIGPAPVGLVVGFGVMVIPVVLAFGPPNGVQLALLVVGGALFAVIGAAMFPLSSLGADAARVSHVTVMGLLGVVWAAGFAVVPLVLGAVASTTSTATAFTLASLLCLPSLVLLVISVRRLGALAAVPAA